MTKEALKLALEDLKRFAPYFKIEDTITAIKEALEQAEFDRVHELLEKDAGIHVSQQAQPEQKPVAHWSDCAVHNEPAYPKGECDCGGYSPEKELFDSARSFYNATVADLQVRITSKDQNKRDVASEAANRLRNALLVYKNITPPQRPWVGLTDEEITTLDMETSGTTHDFVDAVEAALRSKNT